jgi:amphi-Trp domain-containing protein
MDMIEHSTEQRLSRESAARRLRELADELSRHNEIPFVRDGVRYTLEVPDEVTYSVEIEVEDEESEIEIEIKW